jgi:hypothetical protein
MLLVALLMAGCAASKNDLTHTRASDPIWRLNPDKWPAPANDPAGPSQLNRLSTGGLS